MSPPVMEVRRSNGQKVSRLRVPQVSAFGARGGPIRVDDENWQQTLTLNLVLNQMNVQNASRQYVSGRVRLGQIQDADRRWFLVRDWRPAEWTSFLTEFETVTESFWSRRFMLVTPASYDGMNWPQRNPTHRPNVITRLDLDIQARVGRAHYPIVMGRRPVAIWKLATRIDIPTGVRLPGSMAASARDIGRREFRSSASTLVRADAFDRNGRTATHEVGHLTGQRHPGSWRHVQVPGCRDDGGAHACYVGTRPEHRRNIMGMGTGILPENADPWRDLIAEHTSTSESDWRVVVMDSGSLPTPVPLTTSTASRGPARTPPARPTPTPVP